MIGNWVKRILFRNGKKENKKMKFKVELTSINNASDKRVEEVTANSPEELAQVYQAIGYTVKVLGQSIGVADEQGSGAGLTNPMLKYADEQEKIMLKRMAESGQPAPVKVDLPQQSNQQLPVVQVIKEKPTSQTSNFKYFEASGIKFRANLDTGEISKKEWVLISDAQDEYCVQRGNSNKLIPLRDSKINLFKLEWVKIEEPENV